MILLSDLLYWFATVFAAAGKRIAYIQPMVTMGTPTVKIGLENCGCKYQDSKGWGNRSACKEQEHSDKGSNDKQSSTETEIHKFLLFITGQKTYDEVTNWGCPSAFSFFTHVRMGLPVFCAIILLHWNKISTMNGKYFYKIYYIALNGDKRNISSCQAGRHRPIQSCLKCSSMASPPFMQLRQKGRILNFL